MIRTTIAAAGAALLLAAAPTTAQSQQERLDARYDRALAAGYKALFLCSAIANAERNGSGRSAESVERWEMTGIQAPLDAIVPELSASVVRDDEGVIDGVLVDWAKDMPPRVAVHHVGHGCRAAPVGATLTSLENAIRDPVGPATIYTQPPRLAPIVAPQGNLEPVVGQAFAETYGEGSRTTAVLVRQGRATVGEAYDDDFGPNTPQRTWSVAKSIAATLVGAAVESEGVDVLAPSDLGESSDDPRRAITLDHLLRMASGRYSDTPGNRTDPLYFGGSTVAETAAHWPLLHPAGTVYRYANNDTLMAVAMIDHVLDQSPPAEFFKRVGMPHTVAERDMAGDYILSSQVWSTARDLAVLGELYLDDGVLPSGERVLPADWVEYVSSPSGPQPEGRGIGYGAGLWLFNQNEGIPPDTFAAMGNRGQYVVIVPSRDVVIVRRGEDPAGSRFDILAFTRDVLAALEN
ncbi:serine hydrolase domain-containing protein [Erythrobacter litoralis]|uniref:Beta-lactamase class C family protein n=1 Tax=Erythrobacter litoralis (strain HTCC2594) TaxID=314225 RepID=Q2N9D9_ERYLH|nr:serine hydrolase [Erythrobacter litoralis]ABC63702.1 Beta-lactamase class C family protein [Erythrobacter litoralis HTCC2594]